MSVFGLLRPEYQDPPEEMAKPLEWGLLLGVLGVVLGALSASINERLATAGLTDMIGGFGYGRDEGSWIGGSYDVGQIVVLALAPWLASVLSVRLSTVGFMCIGTLAAAACSNAHSYTALLTFRLFQGIGNGGMLPMMLSAMLTIVPRNRKGAALSIYAAVVVFATCISQSLEGVYTDLFVWRSLFWTSIVLAPISVFLVLVFLPQTPIKWQAFTSAEYFGMFTLAAASGFLAVGLDQGQRLDWFDSGFIDAVFFLSVFFFVLFIVNEIAIGSPFYRLDLFAKPTFSAGLVIIFFAAATLLSLSSLFPQEQEMVRQLRPLQVGRTLLWLIIPAFASAGATAALLKLLDARLVLACGFVLSFAGLWGCTWITPTWDGGDFQAFFQVQTVGAVMAITANAFVITGILQQSEMMTGAVMFNLFRTFGFLGGGAILNGIVTVRDRVHSDEAIAAHLDILRQSVRERLAAEGISGLQQAQHLQATVMAVADGFGALALAALLALIVSVVQSGSPVIRLRPKPAS